MIAALGLAVAADAISPNASVPLPVLERTRRASSLARFFNLDNAGRDQYWRGRNGRWGPPI